MDNKRKEELLEVAIAFCVEYQKSIDGEELYDEVETSLRAFMGIRKDEATDKEITEIVAYAFTDLRRCLI